MSQQLADNTNVAEVHQKHNGIYKEVRSISQNPELEKSPKAIKYQKVHWGGQVPTELVKRQFGT